MKGWKIFIFNSYLLLFILLSYTVTFSQSNWVSLKFNHLTTKDGLASSDVSSILQDRYGYIWIATRNGLSKYDGYQFQNYYHKSNMPTSLIESDINTLFIDNKDRFWIGTTLGISRYNETDDNFINYVIDSSDLNDNLLNNHQKFIINSDGTLLVTTEGGFIYQFSESNNRFEKWDTNNFGIIKAIDIDKKGTLYIGSLSGIYFYNKVKKQFVHFSANSGDYTIPSNNITCLTIVSNELWVGTEDSELFTIKLNTYEVTPLRTGNPGHIHVQSITRDQNNNIWVGDISGLRLFRAGKKQSFDYYHIIEDPFSIGGPGIVAIFADKNKNIWLGIRQTGVDYIINNKAFYFYRNEPLSPYGLTHTVISAVMLDSKNNLWSGSFNGGLDIVYRNIGGVMRITNADNHNLNMSSLLSIYEDSDGLVWVGTANGGLQNWDDEHSIFRDCPFSENGDQGVISKDIRCITEDNNKNLWLVTHGTGLCKYNKSTHEITDYRHNYADPSKGILDDWANYVLYSSQNEIWLGGVLGLTKFDPVNMTFEHFIHFKDDTTSLTKGPVNHIYEDHKKNIWVATDQGFCQYDKNTGTFINHGKFIGLEGVKICAILEDNEGNLWISSHKGIYRYNPETRVFKSFDENDGLQGNEFQPASCFKSKKGELFFGGMNGITGFFPSEIKDNTTPPIIDIRDIQLFNESILYPNEASTMQKKLSKEYLSSKTITLNYSQNVLTISYVSLNYINPQKGEYAYQLVGFEEGYNYVGNKREVTYTNLDPGSYIFRVKGTNNDGYWSKQPAELKIIVKPPYWKTVWFRVLIILFAGSLIYYFFTLRMKRIKISKTILEETVRERTQKLQSANEEISKQHEELSIHRNNLERLVKERTSELEKAKLKAEESDRLKSSFLANMSHEIRTPMNAIVGFISLLCEDTLTENEKIEYLQIINRNSSILLHLIDDILDLSKIDAGEVSIGQEPLSIIELINNLYITFAEILKVKYEKHRVELKKNIQIDKKILSTNPALIISTDRQRLSQILSNLLDNASKFTENGFIEIGLEKNLYIDNDGSYLVIYVKDTGIGMAEDHIPYIFDRFRKIEIDKTKFYRGVGLGLSISTKLINKLGGYLKVESTENKGSIFRIYIPYKEANSSISKIIISPAKTSKKIQKTKKIIILVAEDNPDSVRVLEAFLKSENYNIIWADNGMSAVEMALNNPVDLVLMDIKMPKFDGVSAMKKIKEIRPDIPIIAQTAYAMDNEKKDMLSMGFDAYLSKPILPKKLKAKIRQFIK